MTTPTLLSKETINGQTFTSHRALFVTPRGSCGVRITYRLNGNTIPRVMWEKARAVETAAVPQPLPVGG